MIAELYLVAESFVHNRNFSTSEIEAKTKALAEDFREIKKYKETNRLFVHSDIYKAEFLDGITVEDLLLLNPQKVKNGILDRDVYNALKKIVLETQNTSITTKEVIEILLPQHDKNLCHGLIAFSKIDNIEESLQLIYGIYGWYKFRRYFLGLYPKDSDFFIDECVKYYPNLFFHEQNKISINSVLDAFSANITKHLGYLNDVFYTYRDRAFDNESVKYQTFTSECNLEADAASKDNNNVKEKLTFSFLDKMGREESIVCYPHLRLCKSDIPGDSHYYQNRIYFHENTSDFHDGRILIGHIGGHL
jgi:hypothetical protein